MCKQIFLLIFFLATNSALFGQLDNEDYKVYAAVIKTEVLDSTKSIAIIKKGIDSTEKHESTYITLYQLSSKELSNKQQVYFWTENHDKERPVVIDSITENFLVDYCKSTTNKFILANNFNQTYKTILMDKFPIRNKSIGKDWKVFYKKYLGSGGIFSFSKIGYYKKSEIAILYYWVRRNPLNGHGAIAVMTRVSGEWQIKYKTYLWWN